MMNDTGLVLNVKLKTEVMNLVEPSYKDSEQLKKDTSSFNWLAFRHSFWCLPNEDIMILKFKHAATEK